MLAELANLKSVQLDNVFLVTTREHAKELQAEEGKLSESRRRIEDRPAAPANAPAPAKQ